MRARMKRRALSLAVVAALGIAAAPRVAAADGTSPLVVVRDGAAVSCPDADALRSLAGAAIAPAPAASHAYRVVFVRERGTFRADVIDETMPRARALEDHAATCAPLGQAVAVVLAT